MPFSIELLPCSEAGPNNARLGKICVGNFVEQFAVYSVLKPFVLIVEHWTTELQKLVSGATAVGLAASPSMAWILYRFGTKVHVQQVLAVEESGLVISNEMRVTRIPQYEPVGADGEQVSEWLTSVEDVRAFLSR